MPNTRYSILNTQSKSRRLALKSSKGFTLMELLIVMVILGILTTIVASSFSSSQIKARDSRRKNDLAGIQKALEVYYNDNNAYPPSSSGEIDPSNCAAGETCTFGGAFTDTAGTIYMTKVPDENTSAKSYFYYSAGQNQSYAIFARMENDLDKDIPTNATEDPQYYSGTDCGASFSGCNYGLSSSNTAPETNFPLLDE